MFKHLSWLRSQKLLLASFFLFVLALLTRFLFIKMVPTTFSHDEMGYLINAVSLARSGVGRYGDWQPLSLQPVEVSLAELPATYLAPFFLLPLSAELGGRLLSILMSLTMPFLIAGVSYALFKSKKAAWWSWALALFNPWFWQNGRLVFDIPMSLWFYMLGVLLFLKLDGWKKLWSFLPFLVGFYSYQGFKLILIPVLLGLVVYELAEKKISLKNFKKAWPAWLTFGLSILLGQESQKQKSTKLLKKNLE